MNGDVKEMMLTRISERAKNGKLYENYIAKVKVRGIEKDLHFRSVDGWDFADIVFGNEKSLPIFVTEGAYTPEGSERVFRTFNGTVESRDLDGKVYTCTFKPSFDSDKALLRALFD